MTFVVVGELDGMPDGLFLYDIQIQKTAVLKILQGHTGVPWCWSRVQKNKFYPIPKWDKYSRQNAYLAIQKCEIRGVQRCKWSYPGKEESD